MAFSDPEGTSFADAERLAYFCNKNKYFFTFSNGKLTVQNPAAINKAIANISKNFNGLEIAPEYLAVRVTATTTDGTGYSDSRVYMAVEPTTWVKTSDYDEKAEKYVNYSNYLVDTTDKELGWSTRVIRIDTNLDEQFRVGSDPVFGVECSNPRVASANAKYVAEYGHSYLLIHPTATGTTKITITALDGTNRKVTITVKVK